MTSTEVIRLDSERNIKTEEYREVKLDDLQSVHQAAAARSQH